MKKKIYKKALLLLLKEFTNNIYEPSSELDYLEGKFKDIFGVSYESLLKNMRVSSNDKDQIVSIIFYIKDLYYESEYKTVLSDEMKLTFFKKEKYLIYDSKKINLEDYNTFVVGINELKKFSKVKKTRYERKNISLTFILIIFVIFVIIVSIFGGGGISYRGTNVYE